MRRWRVLDQSVAEQDYARVESVILNLELSLASVKRANGCLDLDTVQRIRAHAAESLDNIETVLEAVCTDPGQLRRIAELRRQLSGVLREPAPIQHLARALRVG